MSRGGDVQATFAAVVVDEWVRSGLTDAVVAPGSRSTPLTAALAADGRMRIHVVIDERSAGFHALGLGLGAGRPAVVVTTSGTAAAELHPSVVEAHHAGVALIAVTADRPPELHGVGAPQTIEQERLFGGAVRWQASPGVADLASASSWRPLASRTAAEAVSGPCGPGPVHLNLAFREPLLGAVVDPPAGRGRGQPWHQVSAAPLLPTVEVVADLAGPGPRRGLIVAGGGLADDAPAAVGELARATGWPVLADPRSGCRLPGGSTIAAADALLRVEEVAAWRPELVLRVGQAWASRVLATWLAELGPDVPQVLVDPFGRWADPGRVSGSVLRVDPGALCSALADHLVARRADAGPDQRWAGQWLAVEAAAQSAIDEVLTGHPEVTEPGVARTIVDSLPAGSTLFVSSSMPVRDVEWYGRPRSGLRVLANRGANGIDGVVSTALGVAAGAGAGPTVALVGDLAFLYDAGGLLGAAGRNLACTFVVVDNNGGGIFSFLPQATVMESASFERLWATPHGIDPAAVARAYGVAVTQAARADEVGPAVLTAAGAGGVRVVMAGTERRANVAIHAELEAAVARAVRSLLAAGPA